MTKAVFLDRDGVINCKMPEGDYVKTWEEFCFLPDVKEALNILKSNDFLLFIVTNQRGIAKGIMTEQDLENIHNKMQEELEASGGKIDKIYYCPHDYGQCTCRKPQTGLFLKAKADYPEIEFNESFMIGDSVYDIEAGNKLECNNIMIASSEKRKALSEFFQLKSFKFTGIYCSLLEAVNHINNLF